ncbi:MAG TPA: DUF4388 domain-containing protein [Thermoanaerobaculia bacterium]|jgi:hypothetical protein|nr:DUF4388 domain-containing protein [Thermoanaerobaculia bacterium]
MTDPSLRGNLTSFRLPDVLTFLASARKNGTLTLTSAGKEATVFFDHGSVVYAGSNQEPLRLGAVLLRKKKISAGQRAAIDKLMHAEGGRFGQIAVQEGMLTEDQLRDFLKVQVSEIIYDSFVWSGGMFAFIDDTTLPPYAVTIAIDLSNLIMEGARRIEEWEECERLLPDSSVVFKVVSNPDAEKITLSLDEWKILFLINGRRKLGELALAADEEPLHLYRVIYGLFGNKLIEPVTHPSGPDDTSRTKATLPPLEDTMRQKPATFSADSTVREVADDTNLLVSTEAKLSYKDVVKPTIAQLTITVGDDEGLMFPLTEPEYLIGRQRDNQISLADLGVSGHHARIYRGPEGYAVEDLKSRNGTWLNGARSFHALLKNGDQIRVGATEMRYEILYEGNSVTATAV